MYQITSCVENGRNYAYRKYNTWYENKPNIFEETLCHSILNTNSFSPIALHLELIL